MWSSSAVDDGLAHNDFAQLEQLIKIVVRLVRPNYTINASGAWRDQILAEAVQLSQWKSVEQHAEVAKRIVRCFKVNDSSIDRDKYKYNNKRVRIGGASFYHFFTKTKQQQLLSRCRQGQPNYTRLAFTKRFDTWQSDTRHLEIASIARSI